ncbi:hypothetical protein PC129_g11543 [Phytophthora cactorum]|uniref:Uncharacterized protein n=1 Tax=Phytophthora cactorum TaxID=29920 RepID=A0A329SEL7_9STRA|nr:hypothetical protein GQ600_3118 [Phytophthora cactorum]KAF1791365.1 hypothetical protein GQ600_10065 [Phytophthora cactorum]KAG2766527.1 hypothetical protein Pcac1_g22034 [Phytophthora cactorum]KAG2815635.1 hypothetical protein PC112_g13780 [Phytophthora cactorum]KAG2817125.1 hypothetical protein PC111_g12845 [Phytophthora cactorum]
MVFLQALAFLAVFLTAFLTRDCAGRAGVAQDYIAFEGNIELYSGSYYDRKLLSIDIYMPNRCYNVNCTNIDNKTASAKWSGLPTTGWVGKAFITFYADTDCKGSQTSALLPHNGGIREFVFPKVKGDISSFMVRSESKKRRHGSANVCDWKGADEDGGSVSEADNDKTVKDASKDW